MKGTDNKSRKEGFGEQTIWPSPRQKQMALLVSVIGKRLSAALPLIYFAMEPHGRMTRVSAQAASASKLSFFLRRCPWHGTRVDNNAALRHPPA